LLWFKRIEKLILYIINTPTSGKHYKITYNCIKLFSLITITTDPYNVLFIVSIAILMILGIDFLTAGDNPTFRAIF